MYGRGEVVFYGAFQYDDQNREGQDAYSLANFRGGVRGKFFSADLWIRNAFDTDYIPLASAVPRAVRLRRRNRARPGPSVSARG